MKKFITFLLDVGLCSLSSFGGPEAHYGVFSSILVQRKKYLDEATLTELIGVFTLVPGPTSTQTITAIGYLVGGKLLALLTFIVWAFPAMIIMTLIGIFFSTLSQGSNFIFLVEVLPPIAVGFIVYAGWSLSRKMIKKPKHLILFLAMAGISYFLVPLTYWAIPLLLIVGGLITLKRFPKSQESTLVSVPLPWLPLLSLILIAIVLEVISQFASLPWFSLVNAFYRYGYTVIGGGQLVIPLMIQELVTQLEQLPLQTFLSGYAIDQAIPGPLFSFATFVATQALQGMALPGWLGFFVGGMIFIPGLLLVYTLVPVWQTVRTIPWMKTFLEGITVVAASLLVMTAITQSIQLPLNMNNLLLLVATSSLLISKKISPPILVGLMVLFGYFI